MLTDVLSVDLAKALEAADGWLSDYIRQPHSELGRTGPVCPFVEPAQRAGALEIRVRLVGPTPSQTLIDEIVRCGLDEFSEVDWKAGNPNLRSLLLVLPDLPPEHLHLLDAAHTALKPESVRRGLMIAQFHEKCREKAARNPEFEVSYAPVPMMAVRSMAIHDVLFLADRREWFEEYASRFGARYSNSAHGIDPLLTEMYERACATHRLGAE
jgi:heptaprenyl diphosphate synthase